MFQPETDSEEDESNTVYFCIALYNIRHLTVIHNMSPWLDYFVIGPLQDGNAHAWHWLLSSVMIGPVYKSLIWTLELLTGLKMWFSLSLVYKSDFFAWNF